MSVDSEKTLNKYIETTKLDNIEDYSIIRQVGFKLEDVKLNKEYLDFFEYKTDDDIEKAKDYYLYIYTLGSEQYKKYIDKLGLDYDKISDRGILMDYLEVGYQKATDKKMVYKNLRYTDYKKGDILSGKLGDDENPSDYKLEIGYITDIKPFGLKNYNSRYLIVSEELFNKITNEELPKTLTIYFKSNNANKLQDNIDELLKRTSYSLDNLEENVKVMNNFFTLIGIFLYGFIIVISLIGITNIFNTITTNMELRKQEFAMLKSVGMTKKEFSRMIRLETFFMGIKSLLFGIPIGITLSYIIYLLLAKDAGLPYKLPLLAIAITVIVVFILISVIMKYSVNKINKQNTIETIRNDNI